MLSEVVDYLDTVPGCDSLPASDQAMSENTHGFENFCKGMVLSVKWGDGKMAKTRLGVQRQSGTKLSRGEHFVTAYHMRE